MRINCGELQQVIEGWLEAKGVDAKVLVDHSSLLFKVKLRKGSRKKSTKLKELSSQDWSEIGQLPFEKLDLAALQTLYQRNNKGLADGDLPKTTRGIYHAVYQWAQRVNAVFRDHNSKYRLTSRANGPFRIYVKE